MSFFLQSLFDSLRHLQLPAPEFVCRMRSRQHSPGPEELIQGDVLLSAARPSDRCGLVTRSHGVSIITVPFASVEKDDISSVLASRCPAWLSTTATSFP